MPIEYKRWLLHYKQAPLCRILTLDLLAVAISGVVQSVRVDRGGAPRGSLGVRLRAAVQQDVLRYDLYAIHISRWRDPKHVHWKLCFRLGKQDGQIERTPSKHGIEGSGRNVGSRKSLNKNPGNGGFSPQ